MKITVLGVQRQDYKLDSGYEFHGVKVHSVDEDSAPVGLDGHLSMVFKLSDESPLISVPLIIGDQYNVFFTQNGQVDFLKHV